ncbi:hypothetical protein FRC01_012984, partial [Tulasnella sp. 417]
IHDVAKGIKYLHGKQPPICHGDLKSLNILVNSKNEALITDFGSARSLKPAAAEGAHSGDRQVETPPPSNGDSPKVQLATSGTTMTLTCADWTLRWAAPELLRGSAPGLVSDVWAFGWICWEAMTSNFPFDGQNDVSVVLQIVDGKVPAAHGDGRLDQVVAFASLMMDCWSLDPSFPWSRTETQERTTPCRRNGNESSEIRSARLLTSLAIIHIRNNRMSEAIDHLQQAMDISRSTNDHWAIANTTRVFGAAYRLQEEFTKAEESYRTAGDAFTRIGDQIGLAKSFNGLGEVYRVQGESSKAMEAYIAAREICTRIDHKGGLADSFWGLGQVYLMRGELSQAAASCVAARDIHAQTGNQSGRAYAAKLLGDVYHLGGRHSDAQESYTTAQDAYTRIGDQLGLGNVLTGLGQDFFDQTDYVQAEKCYQEAREIFEKIGNKFPIANNLWSMGWLRRYQNRHEEAEKLVAEALTIYQELGLENDVLDCREFLDTGRK